MRVTQAELARYRRRLAGQAQAARAYVLARVERALAPSASVAEVRDATIEAVTDAIGVYGDQAQAVAADLFDEVMEAEGLKPRATVYEGAIDEAVLEEKVHYYADQLAQGRLARYTRDVGDLAAYYVRRSAYECMVANCVGQRVAFARVPTGRETCGWCLMLASRGFDYATERGAAGGSHEGCDCVIVPGVKGGTEIAGYDPDGLARRWGDCVDTVGGTLSRAETTAMWEALPKEERERLRKRWGSAARERFHTRESTRAARAEAERRDPRWLYRGEVPEIDYSEAARSSYGTLATKSSSFNPDDYLVTNFKGKRGKEWRDLFAHDALSNRGFSVQARKADAPEGFSNIDLLINGDLWEVKSPEGVFDPEHMTFVDDAMKKARKQFDSQFDTQTGEVLDYRGQRRVVLNLFYKKGASYELIKERLDERMRARRIHEVIVVEPDGRIVRVQQKVKRPELPSSGTSGLLKV